MPKPHLGDGMDDPHGGLDPFALSLLGLLKDRGPNVAIKPIWQACTVNARVTEKAFKEAVRALSAAGVIEQVDVDNPRFRGGRFIVTPKGLSL